jgi:hypothetical protein
VAANRPRDIHRASELSRRLCESSSSPPRSTSSKSATPAYFAYLVRATSGHNSHTPADRDGARLQERPDQGSKRGGLAQTRGGSRRSLRGQLLGIRQRGPVSKCSHLALPRGRKGVSLNPPTIRP